VRSGRARMLLGTGGASPMTDDIAEQAMKDLLRTQAKIVSYRKGVANLEAQLPTFPWQKFRPDEVRAMLDALLRVTNDSLTMAEQAIGRLQVERNDTRATIAKLTRELAQAKGQRAALRAVSDGREPPDDDPPGAA
jgi:chromosome segregation ATPase